MSIAVTCSCSRLFKAADDQAGKTIQCPECGRIVTVPDNCRIIKPIVLPPARSWKAILALVLGLGSLVLWLIDPLAALIAGGLSLVLAIVGWADVNRSRGRLRGQALALEGIAVVFFGAGLVAPAVERFKESAARTT